MPLQRSVHYAAPFDAPLELSEVRDRAAQVLRVAREAEVGIDVVAYPYRERVDRLARLALRLERRGAGQELQKLVRSLVAVLEQDVPRHLYRQVALEHLEAAALQKAREVHRRGIRRVRLQQRRREEEESLLHSAGSHFVEALGAKKTTFAASSFLVFVSMNLALAEPAGIL